MHATINGADPRWASAPPITEQAPTAINEQLEGLMGELRDLEDHVEVLRERFGSVLRPGTDEPSRSQAVSPPPPPSCPLAETLRMVVSKAAQVNSDLMDLVRRCEL